MTVTVFVVVIAAAILHATWNALVKQGEDKYLTMAAVVLGHVPFGIAALFVAPTPAPGSWPYIMGGIVLHVGYQWLLLASYRVGDLTQVYPIARGIAPMLVAVVSVLLLGVSLSPVEQAGILIIGMGVLNLGLLGQSGRAGLKASLFAMGSGCFIAGYSLVDGYGARAAGTSLGFYAWLTIGNGIVFAIVIAALRPSALRNLVVSGKNLFFIGGGASFAAYALAMWAFTQAPIALVTALRETSIVFALLIGMVFLGEKPTRVKIGWVMVIVAGAVIIRGASVLFA